MAHLRLYRQSQIPDRADSSSNAFPFNFTVSQKDPVIWELTMAPKDTVLGKVRLIFQVPMSMTSPFLSLFLGTAFVTWLLIPFLSTCSPLWGSKVSKFVITCNIALTLGRVIKHVEECVKQLHTSLDISRGKESQLKKPTRPS